MGDCLKCKGFNRKTCICFLCIHNENSEHGGCTCEHFHDVDIYQIRYIDGTDTGGESPGVYKCEEYEKDWIKEFKFFYYIRKV